ncbi:MAG: hypothetical protein MR384_04010 [Lachnospiraceae bacterium]|nr:hypothetical protein [Lachnospiraceae bacterium]
MDNTISYKCPYCGGTLVWGSKEQKMVCEYCDSKFTEEQLKELVEDDYRKASEIENAEEIEETEPEWDVRDENLEENQMGNMKVHICQSCGGEIIGDENSVATECVYCGSPTIITENISGINRPKYIIPFKLDKKDAKEKLKEFYKGKRLLPNEFSKKKHIESIKGIYVPFWLFDCEAYADITYKTTRTSYWSDSKYNYTKTDHYMVKRGGSLAFEKIPVDGSSKMDDAYMDSIEPFDYNQLTDFSEKYLAGYYADKYDVDANASIPRANERVKRSTEEKFKETVHGYDSVLTESTRVNVKNGKVEYTMFPVWMLNKKYKGKMYMFAMNGQTGKLVGELPIDKGKVFKYLFGITAVLFALSQILVFLI